MLNKKLCYISLFISAILGWQSTVQAQNLHVKDITNNFDVPVTLTVTTPGSDLCNQTFKIGAKSTLHIYDSGGNCVLFDDPTATDGYYSGNFELKIGDNTFYRRYMSSHDNDAGVDILGIKLWNPDNATYYNYKPFDVYFFTGHAWLNIVLNPDFTSNPPLLINYN